MKVFEAELQENDITNNTTNNTICQKRGKKKRHYTITKC